MDFNYIVAYNTTGTTYFKTASGAGNNRVSCKYLDTPARSVTIVNDANTDALMPNVFEDIYMVGSATATTFTKTATTILRRIRDNAAGGSDFLDGPVALGETSLKLDTLLSADETWSGITIPGTLGATIVSGDLIYLNNDDTRWELADANLSDGYDKMLGICLDGGADGDATEILVYGKVRSAAFPAFTVGAPLYMSETAGDVTHTQPTTADVAIRKVGFALTAEDMLFAPSPDYIVHT
jgi:hypothetical protein